MANRTIFNCGLSQDERYLNFVPHDDDTPDALDPVDLCRIEGLDTDGSAGQSKRTDLKRFCGGIFAERFIFYCTLD